MLNEREISTKCVPVAFADGSTMIVCGSRRKIKLCSYCAHEREFVCDFPIRNGRTCDKPLCSAHSYHQGPNQDYCPDHAARVHQTALL